MKPTLFICIGGSGMKIGHALKYNILTYKPELLLSADGSKGRCKFIFIENDLEEFNRMRDEYRDCEGVFEMTEFIQVGRVNTYKVVQKIKNDSEGNRKLDQPYKDINEWVDKTIEFPNVTTDDGLAACRQMGRIALATSYKDLESTLHSEMRKLNSIANQEIVGTQPSTISIYTITGICGGTGSSMFLDIAAMLDNTPALSSDLIKKAIFVNPNYYLAKKLAMPNMDRRDSRYINLQINSVALISECEFFYKMKENPDLSLGKYTARNEQFITNLGKRKFTPFSSAYIFDIIANNTKKIPTANFFPAIGSMLYHSLISQQNKEFTRHDERNASMKGTGFEKPLSYNTLALKVIQYPKEQLEDYFRKRYIYEIFSNVLLKKSIDTKSIDIKAELFVSEAFAGEESTVSGAISDFKKRLTKYNQLEYKFLFDQYLDDDGHKPIKKDEIIQILNNHSSFINEFRQELEECWKTMPDFGFGLGQNNRDNIANHLRNKLIEHTNSAIIDQGYYGVLGIDEKNIVEEGFLNKINKILGIRYRLLTQHKNNFSEQKLLDDITLARQALTEYVSKFRIGSIKLEKLKSLIDSYNNTLNEYFNQQLHFYQNRIEQNIIRNFAVGDQKEIIQDSFFCQPLEKGATELNKYRHGLSIAVGISQMNSSSKESIIRIFDKGLDDDSPTIKNLYTKSLPKRWNDTKEELFTRNVPVNLFDYTDNYSRDNWKAGTEIDIKFKEYVKVNSDEVSKIFEDVDPLKKYPLSKIGYDLDKININIDIIVNKINLRFNQEYLLNSQHEIALFLNKSIKDVFNEGSKEIKNLIMDLQHDLVYPVCDPISSRKPVPFANIHSTLKDFAVNQLKINADQITVDDSVPLTQIVLIDIIQDVDYHGISGNEENLQVYKNRDLANFRPHLHYEWNDYIYGPYEALKSSLVDSDGLKSFNISEFFLICYYFDRLIQIAPEVGKLIFINSDFNLSKHSGLRSFPISYDIQSKSFYVHPSGDVLEEDGNSRFYVIKDFKNLKGNSLGRLFETGKFISAFNEMKKTPGLNESLLKLRDVIIEHQEKIVIQMNDKKKTMENELQSIQESLQKLAVKAKVKNLNEDDVTFIRGFANITTITIQKLLNMVL